MYKDDFNEYKRQMEELEQEDSFFHKYASEKELRTQKKKRSKKMKKLAKKAEKYKKQRRNEKRKERIKKERQEQKSVDKEEKRLEREDAKALKEETALLKSVKKKENLETEIEQRPNYYRSDNRNDEEESTAKIKHPVRTLLIILMLGIVAFVLINFKSFTPDNISDFMSDLFSSKASESSEVSIDDVTVISSDKTNNDVILLTDTSVLNYSQNGALQFERQHGYNSPRLKTAGDYSLVYDSMGKKFRIDSRSKNVLEETIDYSILSADISENKVLALVTEAEGYAAKLMVYDFNFNSKSFKWYSAEHNVIDVSLNAQGDKAAVITCGAENGRMVSSLIVLDFSKDTPIVKLDYYDSFLISVDFKTNSDVTVIGDNICSNVPINNAEKKKDYTFNNYNIKTYSNSDEKGSTILLEKYSDISSNLLVFFSPQGEIYFEEETGFAISAITVSGKNCLAVSENRLLRFDREGTQSDLAELKNEGSMLESVNGNYFVISNSMIEIK